jgi:hypothetical protein
MFLFCLFILSASAQDQMLKQTPKSSPPPGGIRLLTGYVHIQDRGIDTRVGRIRKEGGLDIRYDIGPLAGEYVNRCLSNNTCLWYKEQQLRGGLVKVALRNDGIIFATFPTTTANFYALVRSQEDIADFLLMILTYDETMCCEANETANNSPASDTACQ